MQVQPQPPMPRSEQTEPAEGEMTIESEDNERRPKGFRPNGLASLLRAESGYARHPRTSPIWRWWRPLITVPLACVYFLILVIVLMIAGMLTGITPAENLYALASSMETMPQTDLFFSMDGAYLTLGGLAVMTLAVMLALWSSRERPFGTVISVLGRPRVLLFLKSLVFAFLTLSPVLLLEVAISSGGIPKIEPLSVPTLLIVFLAVALPLQCIAEEVVFRGYIFQTLASWLPRKGLFLAIIGEALLFMSGHGYDVSGQISVLCTGLVYGWMAEKTGGIEAGCSFHIANNCLVFLLMGLGLSDVTSEVPLIEALIDSVATIALPMLFVACGTKFGWLNEEETIEAGTQPCRMFGSQHDALMWQRIQEAQLADWNKFVSQMPSVEEIAASSSMSDDLYMDGEGSIIGIGDEQYDDNQIVSLVDTGAQHPVPAQQGGYWQSPDWSAQASQTAHGGQWGMPQEDEPGFVAERSDHLPETNGSIREESNTARQNGTSSQQAIAVPSATPSMHPARVGEALSWGRSMATGEVTQGMRQQTVAPQSSVPHEMDIEGTPASVTYPDFPSDDTGYAPDAPIPGIESLL